MAKRRLLYCSFCRRDQDAVEKLIGGPGVTICEACVSVCNRILAGKPAPALPGQWRGYPDETLLALLEPTCAAVDATREVLQEHVEELRGRGVAWSRIGEALGISRQAAWERFS